MKIIEVAGVLVSVGLGIRKIRTQIQFLTLNSYMTLGKLLNFSLQTSMRNLSTKLSIDQNRRYRSFTRREYNYTKGRDLQILKDFFFLQAGCCLISKYSNQQIFY